MPLVPAYNHSVLELLLPGALYLLHTSVNSFTVWLNLTSFNKSLLIPASTCVLTLSQTSTIPDTSLRSTHRSRLSWITGIYDFVSHHYPWLTIFWSQKYAITHLSIPYRPSYSICTPKPLKCLWLEWKEGRGKERKEKEAGEKEGNKEGREGGGVGHLFSLCLFVGYKVPNINPLSFITQFCFFTFLIRQFLSQLTMKHGFGKTLIQIWSAVTKCFSIRSCHSDSDCTEDLLYATHSAGPQQ